MLQTLGPEFYILREAPLEDISHIAGPCVAEGIRRLRAGQVARRAGFDGEYGEITLLTPAEIEQFSGQISLFGLDSPTPEAPKKRRPPRSRPPKRRRHLRRDRRRSTRRSRRRWRRPNRWWPWWRGPAPQDQDAGEPHCYLVEHRA